MPICPFLIGCAAGVLAVSAYRSRRALAREWRWMLRDVSSFRAELVGYAR